MLVLGEDMEGKARVRRRQPQPQIVALQLSARTLGDDRAARHRQQRRARFQRKIHAAMQAAVAVVAAVAAVVAGGRPVGRRNGLATITIRERRRQPGGPHLSGARLDIAGPRAPMRRSRWASAPGASAVSDNATSAIRKRRGDAWRESKRCCGVRIDRMSALPDEWCRCRRCGKRCPLAGTGCQRARVDRRVPIRNLKSAGHAGAPGAGWRIAGGIRPRAAHARMPHGDRLVSGLRGLGVVAAPWKHFQWLY